jgi:hypothetical protein
MGRGIDFRNRVWNGVAKLHMLVGRYDNPMPYLVPSPHSGTEVTDSVAPSTVERVLRLPDKISRC